LNRGTTPGIQQARSPKNGGYFRSTFSFSYRLQTRRPEAKKRTGAAPPPGSAGPRQKRVPVSTAAIVLGYRRGETNLEEAACWVTAPERCILPSEFPGKKKQNHFFFRNGDGSLSMANGHHAEFCKFSQRRGTATIRPYREQEAIRPEPSI